MSIRVAMVLVMSNVVMALEVPSVSAASAETLPNILFVLTDDQGWWDLGFRGNKHIETPFMDELAREGVDFHRFYAAPVCAPTRAGLMTGRYCFRTGLYNTRFGGDTLGIHEITIAEKLKQAGYRTGCFGKWHLGRYAPYQPQNRGFDEFLGHYHGHIDEYDYPDQIVHNGKPVEARRYVTDLFTDAAIEFIQSNKDQPWFCFVPYNAPHSPWVVGTSHDGQTRGDRLIEKYLDRGLPLREARIYAMIDIVDQNLGRLLKTLDEAGITDDTVVIFMTDNGGVSKHFKAGLRSGKASIYEGGVRVPFLVRWPGKFPSGGRVEAQCSHTDLFPTLCELAGVELPADRKLDGKSLLPLMMAGAGSSHHPYVYHTWDRYFPNPDNRWAISDERWKLACQVGAGRSSTQENWQLFDLANDPGEMENRIGEHPDVAKRLRAEFLRWFSDVTAGVEYRPVPIPVGHVDEPRVEIQPSWARTHGENISYIFRGYDWDTIEGWRSPGEYAVWDLDVLRGGTYQLAIRYGRSVRGGGTMKISIGDQSMTCQPAATPTADVFTHLELGTITVPKGNALLKAEVIDAYGTELIRLNHVSLQRVETQGRE